MYKEILMDDMNFICYFNDVRAKVISKPQLNNSQNKNLEDKSYSIFKYQSNLNDVIQALILDETRKIGDLIMNMDAKDLKLLLLNISRAKSMIDYDKAVLKKMLTKLLDSYPSKQVWGNDSDSFKYDLREYINELCCEGL